MQAQNKIRLRCRLDLRHYKVQKVCVIIQSTEGQFHYNESNPQATANPLFKIEMDSQKGGKQAWLVMAMGNFRKGRLF